MNEFDTERRLSAVRELVAGTVAAGALAGGVVSLGTGAILGFYQGGILDGLGWNLLLAGYAVALGVAVGALVGLGLALVFSWFALAWPVAAAPRRALELAAIFLATGACGRGLIAGASFPKLPNWIVAGLAGLAFAAAAAWFAGGPALRTRARRLAPPAAALALAGVALAALFPAAPRRPGAAAAPPPGTLSATPTSTAAETPPSFPVARNVLLIVIDTLRADHLSSYGYARATSPRIDAFAREGVRFARTLAQKGRTSPSVATITTGTYPHTHGLLDVRSVLPDEALTLPEILGPRGWRTGGIITNANLSHVFNFQQGFEDYVELGNGELHATADEVTDTAIPWLERHGGEPFFLYLHYVDPHAPYIPPTPYRDRFVGDALYGRHKDLRPPLGSTAFGQINAPVVIEHGSRNVDLYIARYDEEIAFTDAEIGRLLDAVDRLGLRDDTLVILTADHGESMTEHLIFFAHGKAPYDTALRIPLIVRYPKAITGPRVVETAVETTDLAPTILAAVGVPRSPTYEGQSLWPLLLGEEDAPTSRHVFAEEGSTVDSLSLVASDERHKLIFNPRGATRPGGAFRPSSLLTRKGVQRLWWAAHEGPGANEAWELYDVVADPGETKNLYRSRPDLVARLEPPLARWKASAPASRHPKRLALEDITIDQIKQLEALGYVK